MIRSFGNETSAGIVSATLLQEGGVVVRNVAPDDLIDKINQELREPLDTKGHEFENAFNGYKTRRLGAILGLSRSNWLVMQSMAMICSMLEMHGTLLHFQ